MEKEVSDNLTQLWQRLITVENRIAAVEQTPTADILAPITKRVEVLEIARTKQREINATLLSDKQAENPIKPPFWKLW